MTIYDDEIDLRPYIDAILKNWWKISLVAVSLAVIFFIFTKLQAPSYQATATVLVPHSQLKLSLADQFPTIIDSGDARSRMDAYLTIAQSDAIAEQTYQALKDFLPDEVTADDLQESVEITNTGDAILITASAPTTQLAADIANEWARQTVQAINLAYSGEQPLEEIQVQIASSVNKYQETQSALETFIEINPITEIQTTLDIAETALNSYINDQAWQIVHLYQQKQQFTQISDQAKFIKIQIDSGNSSVAGDVGDALAVMNLRARTFSTSNSSSIEISPSNEFSFLSDGPNDISIQLSDPTTLVDSSTNYAQDIETIITLSDEGYQEVNQNLESLKTGSFLVVEEAFTTLASDIQMLKAQLENLTARERELISDRDLAWDTYQVLLQKETEIKTTAQTNAEVTFASPAIPPEEPEARQTLMKTAIAGILGVMIGILWVVIRTWWGSNHLSDADIETISPES